MAIKVGNRAPATADKAIEIIQEEDPKKFMYFLIEEMGFEEKDARKVAYNKFPGEDEIDEAVFPPPRPKTPEEPLSEEQIHVLLDFPVETEEKKPAPARKPLSPEEEVDEEEEDDIQRWFRGDPDTDDWDIALEEQ